MHFTIQIINHSTAISIFAAKVLRADTRRTATVQYVTIASIITLLQTRAHTFVYLDVNN